MELLIVTKSERYGDPSVQNFVCKELLFEEIKNDSESEKNSSKIMQRLIRRNIYIFY